jgi:hypothetical protein
MAYSKLTRTDLMSLEQYSTARDAFRAKVITHKRNRIVSIGPNATWCFEDKILVQYQVQEMLRAERIFEADAIAEELEAYNPLIPDGRNWKVTFFIEFPEVDERRNALSKMKGIEDRSWVQVAGCDKVWAIADEDLDRENDEKTSAVHFLRFELTQAMAEKVKAGSAIAIGIDHPHYNHKVAALPQSSRDSLAQDLD